MRCFVNLPDCSESEFRHINICPKGPVSVDLYKNMFIEAIKSEYAIHDPDLYVLLAAGSDSAAHSALEVSCCMLEIVCYL